MKTHRGTDGQGALAFSRMFSELVSISHTHFQTNTRTFVMEAETSSLDSPRPIGHLVCCVASLCKCGSGRDLMLLVRSIRIYRTDHALKLSVSEKQMEPVL